MKLTILTSLLALFAASVVAQFGAEVVSCDGHPRCAENYSDGTNYIQVFKDEVLRRVKDGAWENIMFDYDGDILCKDHLCISYQDLGYGNYKGMQWTIETEKDVLKHLDTLLEAGCKVCGYIQAHTKTDNPRFSVNFKAVPFDQGPAHGGLFPPR